MAAVVSRETELLSSDTLPPPWGAPESAEAPEALTDPAISVEIRQEPVSGIAPAATPMEPEPATPKSEPAPAEAAPDEPAAQAAEPAPAETVPAPSHASAPPEAPPAEEASPPAEEASPPAEEASPPRALVDEDTPHALALPERAPSREASASPPQQVASAPSAPRRHRVWLGAVAFAVIAGLFIGVWSNQQAVKGPTRELGDRIEATRVDMRADLEQQKSDLAQTKDAVKKLSVRVDTESAERKADHAKLERDVGTIHENVKKQNASTEARIQRLRETLVQIELYHGANVPHTTPRK